MPTHSGDTDDEDAILRTWRQGDFALGVGGFLLAVVSEGDEHFDPDEQVEDIIGMVAISQTCDIVRRTGGRHYVIVCPLIEIDEEDVKSVKKGSKPYLSDIPGAGDRAFADFRRVMSVDKDLVRTWPRQDGFTNENGRVRFAAALERKFGQFAFPDQFDQAMKNFRDRVWKRHEKSDSPIGKVYRSIEQIRFRAEPNWDASERSITVIAILKLESECEASEEDICNELKSQLEQVDWPCGFKWNDPMFLAASANDLTAADIINSRRGDFEFLCY